MERKDTIEYLEFQLSEKKATEDEALSKVQQLRRLASGKKRARMTSTRTRPR